MYCRIIMPTKQNLSQKKKDAWKNDDIVTVIRPKSKGGAMVIISAEKLHAAANEIEKLRKLVSEL